MKRIPLLPLSLLLLASCAQQPPQSTAPVDDQQLFIGDNIAVAKTQYGYVKGYILHGTYTYLGIPYGKTTEGEGRFLPAQAPTAWTDTLPTVFYGASAPQFTEGKYANNYYTFSDHWNYYDVGEDCLKLNVWTQGLADGKKRPVLFWIHGGGFTNGNGIEQDGYHGENFSRYGDVVFVSVNHRLGPIGFSDFFAVHKMVSGAVFKYFPSAFMEMGGYLFLTLLASFLLRKLEKKLAGKTNFELVNADQLMMSAGTYTFPQDTALPYDEVSKEYKGAEK